MGKNWTRKIIGGHTGTKTKTHGFSLQGQKPPNNGLLLLPARLDSRRLYRLVAAVACVVCVSSTN